MKFKVLGVLLILQNLLLNESFSATSSSSIYSFSEKIRMENARKISSNFFKEEDNFKDESRENGETELSRSTYPNILKGQVEKYKPHIFKKEYRTNSNAFPDSNKKRSLLSFPDDQISSLVQESSVKNENNGITSLFNSQAINQHISPEIDKTHEKIIMSITPSKTFHHVYIGVTNSNKSNETNNETAAYLSMHGSDLNGNGILYFLNNKSDGDWYTSLVSLIDIKSFLKTPNAEDSGNSTMPFRLNRIENEMFDKLAENFDCVIDETLVLNISCVDVDFYSIGEYLPNETTILDLSYGNEVKLIKPLFPHLKNLKSLILSHNHHRYITRAFMGLEYLESLDLSNNDIIVIMNAFSYVPRLRSLNLSKNQIRRIRTISNAVRYLKNLENLILDHNVYISYIEKEDLYNLKNCNIRLFSLFNTTLQYVVNGSFSAMPNLKILELSVNYINEQALANVTCGLAENVEILYFGQMLNIKEFPVDAVQCLTNVKVKELNLWYNYFSNVPKLPNLPYLQSISLSNCSIDNVEENAFENIPNVKIMFLRGNNLVSIPSAITSLTDLEKLYIDSQNVDAYHTFSILDYVIQNLTNLKELSISRIRLGMLSRYSLNGARNLTFLFLSQSSLFNIKDYAFETLTSLELLDLRGNGLKVFTNFTFYGLHQLKYLYLSGNFINFFDSVYPFQFSPSLFVLFLQFNKIEHLPDGIFSKNEYLNVLILGRNKISSWNKRVLHPKARLQMFELSENNIDYISDIMLEEFNQVTEFLDIGKNPFNCSKCGMKEFQKFCLTTNLSLRFPTHQTNDNAYRCMNPQIFHNKNLFDIELPEVVCVVIETHLLNMMNIILVCLFMILVIGLALICYTFRWYIRYWIFHIKTDFKRKISSCRENNYIYDAFIIYSSCDTAWLINHLIPALENQEPYYKLCIHQRDFQVGRQITENILEAIENSRKVILILTEGFINSEWCMYELHLAQHKLFRDTRDNLILVKLKAIDKKFYSKNLSYIEKTRRCFMWTDNQIGQKLFWNQIRKQLGQPNSQAHSRTDTSKC